MQESFYKSELLSKEELHKLMVRDDTPGIFRFLVLLISFSLSSFAIINLWGGPLWGIVLAHLAFGVVCCNAFACLHESAHGTAFNSKKLNKSVAFIAGILHIYPVAVFKSLHFTHHRYTHIPGKDPEISIGNRPAPALLGELPIYLVWITGIPILLFKVAMMIVCTCGLPEFIRTSFFPFINSSKRSEAAVHCAIVLAVYTIIIYLALTFHPGFWGILTGQIVGHCILATYLIMEHNGLPHEGNILTKTRSINTNDFMKFVMWNMPYHAEHHAYPAVPFHALPKLHATIESELIHKKEGVGELHMKMIQGEFK